MKRVELEELARLVKKLGEEVEAEERESDGLEDSERSGIKDFYLPKVPWNFYYDAKVFRRLLGIR